MHVIELEKVCFHYGSQKVLDNVTLRVPQGDYLAILGPNGSGKTTLLKIMLGLLPADCGSVKLLGTPIEHFRGWNKIGFVPQKSYVSDPDFPATVREVVSTGLYYTKGYFNGLSKVDWKKVDAAIAKVGLSDLAAKQIGELSGGQQQRTFIAKALVNEPRVLMLDEPTASIDVPTEKRLYQLLEKLNREGVSILLVSHDIGLVSRKVKTILCMDRENLFHGDSKSFRKLVAQKPGQLFDSTLAVRHHHHH